jgi:hypothetical protein
VSELKRRSWGAEGCKVKRPNRGEKDIARERERQREREREAESAFQIRGEDARDGPKAEGRSRRGCEGECIKLHLVRNTFKPSVGVLAEGGSVVEIEEWRNE